MKKLLLCVALAAFAGAVQAGDTKSAGCDKETSCCASAKATQQTKAECPMKQAKAGTCCASAKVASKEAKPVLHSPKAFADAK